ncbi:MAG: hypothetical protein M3N08_08410 [Pseudomonadota bacterium]|nr:hypothetical protein [Pseudomonadota bacterium]
MLRHIAWFNEAAVQPHPDGLTSPDATVQRRCLTPARAMENLGVECSVFGNLSDADPAQVSKHLQKLETDIVVICKISEPSRLRLARAAKQMGCYVVADFGYEGAITADLIKLAEVADQIVVSTEKGATELHAQTGLKALIIPDCGEQAGELSAKTIAELWLACFRTLKIKPPPSANTNTPQ